MKLTSIRHAVAVQTDDGIRYVTDEHNNTESGKCAYFHHNKYSADYCMRELINEGKVAFVVRTYVQMMPYLSNP